MHPRKKTIKELEKNGFIFKTQTSHIKMCLCTLKIQ